MALTESIDAARIGTVANVYFDGRCVSHGVTLADGTRKSVGVILPSTLTFKTAAAEVMECVRGACRVRIAGQQQWREYAAGDSFEVPANSSFEIEVADQPYHYICHFA